MSHPIDIHVRLDARTFRRFCRFDAFRRQRRWYLPVLLGMVLVTLSLAGLFGWLPLSDSASGVLMGLGLAVPMVAFGLFFIQVEAQVARLKLKSAPAVYSLRLGDAGVRVTNDQKAEPPIDLPWERLWAAFRRPGAIYLYANPQRAFILPDGQADVPPDAVWAHLKKRLGEGRCLAGR